MIIESNKLEEAVLATIAYFDVFDYPLTIVELWKWLYRPGEIVTLSDLQKNIESSDRIKTLVETRRGFYFLKGRGDLLTLRQARYNLAEKKFKKASRVAKFLKMIPGVKMIAVCNSLAWSNASEGSDIDLFVVTAKQKIWTVRFWAAGFLKLLGLRPKVGRVKDKICLSFFVDEENLNLEKISLDAPDIYLIYWIVQAAPVYDVGGIYQKFLDANTWIKQYLPNFFVAEPSPRRQTERTAFPIWLGGGEKFFRRLEFLAMPANLREMANKDSRVIVNDSMLKFHANDRRAEYKDRWMKRVSELVN